MNQFTKTLKVLSLITIAIGLFHVALGPKAQVYLGANLPENVINDPVLYSQDGFYSVIFICYGVLLFLSATDLNKYATVFRILAGFLFVGGIVRLTSVARVGVPSAPVIILILIELILPPLLWWWFSRLSKQSWPLIPE